MEALIKTYDSASPRINEFLEKEPMENPPLLPLCVTTQVAHIQVLLGKTGEFQDAFVIDKENSTTIVPCSEKSAGRTGTAPSPHPLHDKLQFVAGDYSKYSGSKKSEYNGYNSYLNLISDWCESEFSHPRVEIVKNYVSKGTLIEDLVKREVLLLNSSNTLMSSDEYPDTESTRIFKNTKSQKDLFVRWDINDNQPKLSMDRTIWSSWKEYYLGTMTNRGLCSVSGKETILASSHPAKIRNSGDRAKLISSNDKRGFTYRGRFETPNQLCAVGYEESQKAHNALRWLIGRQGYRNDKLAIVSWTASNAPIPSLMSDFSKYYEENFMSGYVGETDAKKFRNALNGYYSHFDPNDNVFVMALDSSEFEGRLSILTYRELSGSSYLERIAQWNKNYSWIHDYKEGRKQRFTFEGAPAPEDVAKAVLGNEADKKSINHMIKRILPCIIDGTDIPRDIVELSIRRASNPSAYNKREFEKEWNKILSIACSLYKGTNRQENYKMSLDMNRHTRDYLYGRLLATAHKAETDALEKNTDKRQTNAMRFMQKFRDYPYTTWINIEMSLNPYIMNLEKLGTYYMGIITEITDSFEYDDFVNNKQLSGEFLLGFHSQMKWFYTKKSEREEQ